MDGTRGWLGVLVALSLIIILQAYLVNKANKSRPGDKKLSLFDLIVTSEDNRYSLSRLQIYIWTIWIAVAFCATAFFKSELPVIHENVAIMLGLSGLTAVLSSTISNASERQNEPNFFKDVFLDKSGTLDLARTQMFIWTFLILVTHITLFWDSFYKGSPEITDLNRDLLILMGVSNATYLGVKKVDEKNKIS